METVIFIILVIVVIAYFFVHSSKNDKNEESQYYYEPDKNIQSENLQKSNSDTCQIPGVNEYGVDTTVFDPMSVDINELDPIRDHYALNYMLALGAGEEEASKQDASSDDSIWGCDSGSSLGDTSDYGGDDDSSPGW